MRALAIISGIVICIGTALAQPPQAPAGKGIEGDWQGTLRAGKAELRLVVHITKNPNGLLSATMDSIDEGATGIPITEITFQDSKLTFSADSIQANYEGHANSDLTSINGSWSQAGNNSPLNLKRAAAPAN